MKSVLVLCTGNSCRSQIAHGYLKHFGNGTLEVESAGIETHGVNPRAIKVMGEDGVDISGYSSDHIDKFMDRSFDYVITVCDHAKESCPYFPNASTMIHHNFTDPAKATGTEEEILNEFRRVREEIKEYSREFVGSL